MCGAAEKVYEADRDSFQNTSTTHQCTVVFWSEPLPADALNVNNMNVKPVGAQAVLYGEGRMKQTLIDSNGIPKGMKQILKEHGINTDTLKGPDTRIIWALPSRPIRINKLCIVLTDKLATPLRNHGLTKWLHGWEMSGRGIRLRDKTQLVSFNMQSELLRSSLVKKTLITLQMTESLTA